MLDITTKERPKKYAARKRNIQVRFRLSKDNFQRLEKEAQARRVSVNYLIGVVIDQALSEATPEKAWETGLKMMSEVRARQKAIGQDFECLFETLCLFVYQWFCHTMALPESQKRAAAIDGKQRFEKFLDLVRTKLNDGRSPFSRLLEGEATEGRGKS